MSPPQPIIGGRERFMASNLAGPNMHGHAIVTQAPGLTGIRIVGGQSKMEHSTLEIFKTLLDMQPSYDMATVGLLIEHAAVMAAGVLRAANHADPFNQQQQKEQEPRDDRESREAAAGAHSQADPPVAQGRPVAE